MPSKKYPVVSDKVAAQEPAVEESRAQPYRRGGLHKQLPLWLRRLDRVKAEMKRARFPRTAQEGFRQCVELSATARHLLWESIRSDHPGASDEKIEKERRLLLARHSAAEARRIIKWKKERDRYFRG
jgi:hypothetical protein